MVAEDLLRLIKKWDCIKPGTTIRPDNKLNENNI
jgi:hypothetical protein